MTDYPCESDEMHRLESYAAPGSRTSAFRTFDEAVSEWRCAQAAFFGGILPLRGIERESAAVRAAIERQS